MAKKEHAFVKNAFSNMDCALFYGAMKRFRILVLAAVLTMGALTGARAQVLMDGDVDFVIYGSRVRVYVEDITNFGSETSGRLRFILWASEDRWEEFDRGRLVGFALLPRLAPQQDLDDVRRTLHFNRPPTGWYYLTLTLEERVFDTEGQPHWEIRDVVEFDDRHYFRRGLGHWPFPF